MTMTEITRRFTEAVNEYLAKGYVFSGTMRGSQGEMMKVDLTDGKEVIRINLQQATDFEHFKDMIVLTVESFEAPEEERAFRETLWTGNGNQVSEVKFYELSNYRSLNKFYTDDEEEYKRCCEKADTRCKAHSVSEVTTIKDERAYKIVISFVKRQKGFKCKKVSDISKITKRNGRYEIYFNGKYETLTLSAK